MMIKNLRTKCDDILIAMLGSNLAKEWWQRGNKAFDMLPPEEVWKTDSMKVYTYLAHQANSG